MKDPNDSRLQHPLFPCNKVNLLHNSRNITRFDRHPVLALPLSQSRTFLAILFPQRSVQLQPLIPQAMHVDGRQPQNMLSLLQALAARIHRQPDLGGVDQRWIHEEIRIQRHEGPAASDQDPEAEIRA